MFGAALPLVRFSGLATPVSLPAEDPSKPANLALHPLSMSDSAVLPT